jgi:hypothetical protein
LHFEIKLKIMPTKKQFSMLGNNRPTLIIVYGAFLELGWMPKYAGPNAIVDYTPGS